MVDRVSVTRKKAHGTKIQLFAHAHKHYKPSMAPISRAWYEREQGRGPFRMSLFEKFTYRRKETMVVNGNAEEENTQDSGDHRSGTIHQVIPNKAHLTAVTSIPETPGSLLPVPPSQKRKQKRRRARISSSSEEDETETVPPVSSLPPQGRGSCSLFSELPISKRRKKEANGSQAEAAKPEECESGFQQRRKWTSGLHSNPKRLFSSSGDDEDNGPLPSSSPSYCRGGKSTAATRGKIGKGKIWT